MTTKETVKVLSTLTTRDDAGRHFSEQFIREFRVAATARVVPLFLDAAAGIARRSKDEKQAAKIEAVAEMCRRGMSPENAQEEVRSLHPRPSAYGNANARDKFLRAVADSVEAALRACGSPGIALLDQLPLTPATETE